MGVEFNVSFSKFPKQGEWLGKRTRVCFNYDTDNIIWGIIVRDDIEQPFKTIIKLDDNRYILATECMHSPI